MSATVEDFVDLANRLADASRPILRSYYRRKLEIDIKSDASPVTQADREAEAAIRKLIAARFPEHGIFGEEFARYAFIWLAYVATSRGVRNRTHLSIDMLRDRFGRSGKFVLYLFSDVCFLTLAVVVVYTSAQFVIGGIRFDQRFTGSDLPLWLATSAVPVGWSLVCLRVVQRSVALVRTYRSGAPLGALPADKLSGE